MPLISPLRARTAILTILAIVTITFAGAACTPAKSPGSGAITWRELESEHFRLVTDLDAEDAETELDAFERSYDAMVQAAFPRGAIGRMRLVVFRNDEELHAFATNAQAGLFVDGWAMEDDETGTALFAGGIRERSRATFQHELAHRLLAAGFADVPMWFSEGLAVYLQSMRVEGDRVILGDWSLPYMPLPAGIATRKLTVLDRDGFYLGGDRGDLDSRDRRRVAGAYLVSWHLVHLLRNGPDPIRERFRRVVASVNDGAAFAPAWRDFVSDVGEEELDRALVEHSADRTRLSSVYAFTPSPRAGHPKTRDLSIEETHLLFAKLRLAGPTPHRALPEVDRALRQAPTSFDVRLARAYVLLEIGDDAGAMNAFTALATEAPANAAALAGLLHAMLDRRRTKPVGADAERMHDLATRLAGIATKADEHRMAISGLAATDDITSALAASAAAVRAHPTSYRLLAIRAMILAHEGHYPEATTTMRRALEVMPERRARGPEGRAHAQRLAEFRAAAREEPPR